MSDQELIVEQPAATPELSPSEVDQFFNTKGGETNESVQPDTEIADDSDTHSESESVSDESTEGDEGGDSKIEEIDGAEPETNLSEQQRYKSMADAERIKRKEIQKQIDKLNQENEQLKNTFNRILTKAQEQELAQKQAQIPVFEDDPIAYLKWENEQLKTQVQEVNQERQQTRQEREMQNAQQQFLNNYKAASLEFKKVTPDFDDAYQFLLENRKAEYETAGYDAKQIENLLFEDEAAIAANHLRQGNNPAEAIYKLAKLRGYQGKSNINTQAANQINANQQKIANLERGLKASKSVNNTGSSVNNSLSLEAIAAMDDDDFAKFDWNKLLKMG